MFTGEPKQWKKKCTRRGNFFPARESPCCSLPDTALRDITQLLELGVLKKSPGGGRGTGYVFARPQPDIG
ncbi:hypothetical protein [Thauera linaloolentis]|uniref:hypothetical protein n=1 Tax=Thauera linaloolentis TaxID=76112 RepID=UPI0002D3B2EC|nr:hypothetical protein [Thauera linaloolentis]MCM8566329.1 hypothetical protein [Thauera linaloolentis]